MIKVTFEGDSQCQINGRTEIGEWWRTWPSNSKVVRPDTWPETRKKNKRATYDSTEEGQEDLEKMNITHE